MVQFLVQRPLFASSAQKEVTRALNQKLDHWLPHDPAAARAAVDQGKPLAQVKSGSPLSKAIARLAKDTLAVLPAQQAQASRSH